MQVIKDEGSFPIKAWVGTKAEVVDLGHEEPLTTRPVPDIEDSALKQLKNLARLPFIHSNGVAVMPDVHAGIGATVGSVIATRKAVIPAAVGVDIGCGMVAVRTSLRAEDLPDSLLVVRQQIERDVPVGFSQHQDGTVALADNFPVLHGMVTPNIVKLFESMNSGKYAPLYAKAAAQLGTLGGGNHFIEICLDEAGAVWVMLHSGSRGIGNMIGRKFIERAKEECERWHIQLPDNDLAYLPEGTKAFDDYVAAVEWAQGYAFKNREIMLKAVIAAMQRRIMPFTLTAEAINCHHNYISRESHFGQNLWVTRKGAIQAREGALGIIPGSMGTRSYIVKGKGNPESYCSCSHGAGRRMSRTAAGKHFSLTDLVAQTEGVECRKDNGVLDEIPGAYKDIDAVMANQTELVEVVHTLKQVLCVKG